MGNTFEMIQTISKMIPYNINTTMVANSIERYRLLNDNKIQFMMSRGHTLFNVIYKTMPGLTHFDISHIRFVCALYRLPINIISCALKILEFGDLKNSCLTVNIGPKYSGDYFAALDLFLKYDIIVGSDIFLTHYELDELIKHYGVDVDVAIVSLSHPDQPIVELSNKKLSRFVEIKKYNDGDVFHITLEEEPFYKEHPYYLKTILEKDTLFQYYPNMVLYERRLDPDVDEEVVVTESRFINTIGVRYYLLSNEYADPVLISQLLYNMKLNMNIINKLPFVDDDLNSASLADFTLPIEPHYGARDFFTKSGLFTNIKSNKCIFIDGKCDFKQLYEHHLYHDFGPTFDQLYNSDSTNNPYVPKRRTKLIIA